MSFKKTEWVIINKIGMSNIFLYKVSLETKQKYITHFSKLYYSKAFTLFINI